MGARAFPCRPSSTTAASGADPVALSSVRQASPSEQPLSAVASSTGSILLRFALILGTIAVLPLAAYFSLSLSRSPLPRLVEASVGFGHGALPPALILLPAACCFD